MLCMPFGPVPDGRRTLIQYLRGGLDVHRALRPAESESIGRARSPTEKMGGPRVAAHVATGGLILGRWLGWSLLPCNLATQPRVERVRPLKAPGGSC
jgi:hypothetical protein